MKAEVLSFLRDLCDFIVIFSAVWMALSISRQEINNQDPNK